MGEEKQQKKMDCAGRIVVLKPEKMGAYASLAAGTLELPFSGSPLLLGYEKDGAACGVLTAICQREKILLRWIAVDTPCQRQGIGGMLLETFCIHAARAGAKRINAEACLPLQESLDARRFLERQGFLQTKEAPVYGIALGELRKGPLGQSRERKRDAHVTAISELPTYAVRDFLTRQGLLINGKNAITGDLLLPELSMVWQENGQIAGCILVAACGNELAIQWLWGKGISMVQGLVLATWQELGRRYQDPSTRLHIAALEERTEALVKKLTNQSVKPELLLTYYKKML